MAETTATPAALAASGQIIAVKDGGVVFNPAGTSYELQLSCVNFAGALHKPVRGVIRVRARKIWTVPSGGNFISPIFGPPRIIQGRVRALDRSQRIVQAGTMIVVDLPDDEIVYDLACGPIVVGGIVNVTAVPGASFELQT